MPAKFNDLEKEIKKKDEKINQLMSGFTWCQWKQPWEHR